MAKANFRACLKATLAYEGGYTNDRRDPGNWTGGKVGVGELKGTKYGVAANSFPDLDIKNLTVAQVEPIYRVKYWNRVAGDELPYGVDMATWDYGVNSGPPRAVRSLQAALGVHQDGAVGAATLAAVTKADGKTVIQKVCRQRLGFMQGLKTWNTFKRGWSRRVSEVEALAVSMWLSKGKALTHEARKELASEADAAKSTAAKQEKGAAAGGAAGGGGAVAVSGDINWLLVAGVVVVVAVVVALVIFKARQNRDRQAAYLAAAAR